MWYTYWAQTSWFVEDCVNYQENAPNIPMEGLTEQAPAATVSASEIPGIIQRVIGKWLNADVPLDELVAVREEDHPRRPGRKTKHAEYELRHRVVKFSEGGMAGRVTARLCEFTIAYFLQCVLDSLKAEQPTCNWRMVAAKIWRVDFQEVRLVGVVGDYVQPVNIGDIAARDREAQRGGPWRPSPQNMSNSHQVQRPIEYRWEIEVVFADIAQADITDPTVRSTNDHERPTWWTGYIESERDIGKMGEGHRKRRDQALKVIAEFKASAEPSDRTMLVAAPEATERRLTEEQLEQAADMRLNGITFAMAARMLAMDADDLEAQVTEWEARKVAKTPPPETPAKRRTK